MRGKEMALIVATAVVVVTVCSTCSPLYAFNVSVDANCFMTVGRSMLHGLVPYRDLFEHKGPLHYMLHALAALVSERTFLGVYLLEVVCSVGFLYWGFKTFVLCVGEERRRICLLLVPVLAMLAYTARAFFSGDQGSEELLLPLYMYTVYAGVKAIKEMRLPTVVECLLVGLAAGFVLWTKFTMLGVFVGWYLFFVYKAVRQGGKAEAAKMLGWMALGALIPTAIALIFFAVQHALGDMLEVYFYDNLFRYPMKHSGFIALDLVVNLFRGLISTSVCNPLATLLLIVGAVFLWLRGQHTLFSYLLTTFVFSFLLIFSGQSVRYYSFVFFAFVPLVLCVVSEVLVAWLRSRRWARLPSFAARHKLATVSVCCLVLTLVFSQNVCNIGRPKNDYPQYQFAEIINRQPNATLLNYGSLDMGFYMAAGIVPNCKFFCKTNLCKEETSKEQEECVDKGMVDFVVVDEYTDFENERYKLVAEATFERFPAHSLRGLLYFPSKKRAMRHKREELYRLYRLKEGE